MHTSTLQPVSALALADPYGGPTLAHKAGAFMILIAASAGFVVMVLWPVVVRFT